MKNLFTIVYFWRPSRLGISEGLNVLLTDLIRGLQANRIPIRILTTGRHINGLHNVLLKNNISLVDIEIVQLIKGSIFLRFKDFWLEIRKERDNTDKLSLWTRIRLIVSNLLKNWLFWSLDIGGYSTPIKVLSILAVTLLIILVSPLLLSILLVCKLFSKLKAVVFFRFRQRLTIVVSGFFSASAIEKFYIFESQRLAAAIDKASNISSILLLTGFDGDLCANIRKKSKVIVFPDATPLLLPTRFPGSEFADILLRSMRKSVKFADGIICYSNFVRDHQLKNHFSTECGNLPIKVIPQGFFAGNELGEINKSDAGGLNKYIRNYFPEYGDLPRVHFNEFLAIIYPTVDRPHKNTLTLLRAFERLLRQKGRNVKLIMTSPGGTLETMNYIRERKLHRDVLFMPAVPIAVLNQLLGRATVMVHPSLLEGGDIFNFSRAVSHNTPALLSDILVAREMFERNSVSESVYEDWLFEPTDHQALAEKIDSILCDRWNPLAAQRVIMDHLSSYTFAKMAQTYNDFMREVSSKI